MISSGRKNKVAREKKKLRVIDEVRMHSYAKDIYECLTKTHGESYFIDRGFNKSEIHFIKEAVKRVCGDVITRNQAEVVASALEVLIARQKCQAAYGKDTGVYFDNKRRHHKKSATAK